MKLIADNMRSVYPYTKLCDFQYNDGKIESEPLIVSFSSAIEHVTIVEDKIDDVEHIELIPDEPGQIMPVNQPLMGNVMVGFDVYQETLPSPLIEQGTVEEFVTMIIPSNDEATYIQKPLHRYVFLDNKVCVIEEGVTTMRCDGGQFKVRDDITGEYVNKDVIFTEQVDEYIPFFSSV